MSKNFNNLNLPYPDSKGITPFYAYSADISNQKNLINPTKPTVALIINNSNFLTSRFNEIIETIDKKATYVLNFDLRLYELIKNNLRKKGLEIINEIYFNHQEGLMNFAVDKFMQNLAKSHGVIGIMHKPQKTKLLSRIIIAKFNNTLAKHGMLSLFKYDKKVNFLNVTDKYKADSISNNGNVENNSSSFNNNFLISNVTNKKIPLLKLDENITAQNFKNFTRKFNQIIKKNNLIALNVNVTYETDVLFLEWYRLNKNNYNFVPLSVFFKYI